MIEIKIKAPQENEKIREVTSLEEVDIERGVFGMEVRRSRWAVTESSALLMIEKPQDAAPFPGPGACRLDGLRQYLAEAGGRLFQFENKLELWKWLADQELNQ